MRRFFFALASVIALSACGEDTERAQASASIDAGACDSSTTVVNKPFRPVRSVMLLTSPEEGAAKVLNEKATRISGEQVYHSISGAEQVLEQCQKGDYSYVTMLEPEWLKGNSGWVLTDELKKKKNPDDPYEGLIAEWILVGTAYQEPIKDDNGNVSSAFKGKLPEIKKQLVAAARKAIDSGSCSYVEGAMFDRFVSTREKFTFIVDCSGGKRFTFSSQDLQSSTPAAPDGEKAISEAAAQARCKDLILAKVVRPNTTRFDELVGSSYYKNTINGNVRYILDFDSENGLGQKMKYKAVCIFEPSGHGEITVSER